MVPAGEALQGRARIGWLAGLDSWLVGYSGSAGGPGHGAVHVGQRPRLQAVYHDFKFLSPPTIPPYTRPPYPPIPPAPHGAPIGAKRSPNHWVHWCKVGRGRRAVSPRRRPAGSGTPGS